MTIAALLTAATLLLLLFTAADSLGSASTLAIVHGTGTVCGVLAATSPASIQCARGSQLFSVLPNVSFSSVSGGRDFFCGLRSGGNTLLLWNTNNNNPSSRTDLLLRPNRRLYTGPVPLQGLSVGEDHISAVVNGTGIRWWRSGGRFPITEAGQFRSLTSGDGFSCAIQTNDSQVRCWGSRRGIADEIWSGFTGVSMDTIVAGDSHACGINMAGFLVCKGSNEFGQLNAPSNSSAFEFSQLALGQRHSCAVRSVNDTVVCWGGTTAARTGTGNYFPVNDTQFVSIVVGGNLTCGITASNFSVMCWEEANLSSATLLPLKKILPGICTTDRSSCGCGEFPDYETLCSGSGIICKPCDRSMRSPPPSPLPSPGTPPKRTSKWPLAFAIVGSVGALSGVCTLIYCLWMGICRRKKIHNSVQPTIARNKNSGIDNAHAMEKNTSFSCPSRSRSRQGSRVFTRQRSGPSSAKPDRAEEFTFDELAAATNNFSSETKIGSGSFGTVYKGKLADGREVAIKRGETSPRTRKFQEKECAFQSELAFLSRLHHKHLVGFVGFCEEEEERLLVYEFMKNGALYDHIHSNGDGGVLNSWRMRIKVLLDAARGIEYLHNYAVPPIIHRDIKSSNILLDGNWTARVSDFGLSLSGPESEGEYLSMKAAGTMGYMDPEYYGLHHLTVKSDVYGLGVVMLEVLTGKRAIFKGGDGNPKSVVDYAVPMIVVGEVVRVLDERVGSPGTHEGEAVERVAYTAVHCVNLEGRERPTMTDVVANLENALALCDEGRVSFSSASISFSSYDREF